MIKMNDYCFKSHVVKHALKIRTLFLYLKFIRDKVVFGELNVTICKDTNECS